MTKTPRSLKASCFPLYPVIMLSLANVFLALASYSKDSKDKWFWSSHFTFLNFLLKNVCFWSQFGDFFFSAPKHEHPRFEGGRSVCWPVSRAARSYVAGERLLELSLPKARKALFEGYDPYIVSRAARSASPSPRIQELSMPLPRKCSSK